MSKNFESLALPPTLANSQIRFGRGRWGYTQKLIREKYDNRG
ncbi:hypothetical protein HPSSW114_1310 [Glaesserella parasuis SW114]|nr:hypothetical protein HPSSW114_1310 [Glaesserella parasuis SW114]